MGNCLRYLPVKSKPHYDRPQLEENECEPMPEHGTSLSDLPKTCISLIFSFTTPRQVCRLETVSKLFRSAAYSDIVWNKFLPKKYQQILSRAVTPIAFSSSRELYFRLCDSVFIDGGTKRFWLERSTAKMGYMLSARELSIAWGDDQRYWRWVFRAESRFKDVAELLSVCWLEVRGRIDCSLLSANTEYRVVCVLKFGERPYGWSVVPIKFSVSTADGKKMESEHLLMERQGARRRINSGGWMEVVAGDFAARANQEDHNSSNCIEFCMAEVNGGHWKGGLLVDGISIEPKSG